MRRACGLGTADNDSLGLAALALCTVVAHASSISHSSDPIYSTSLPEFAPCAVHGEIPSKGSANDTMDTLKEVFDYVVMRQGFMIAIE